MIDYKLFLILILSLVLLYTYNRVETVKFEVENLKNDLKKQKDNDKCKFVKKDEQEIEDEISKFKKILDDDNIQKSASEEINLDEIVNNEDIDLDKLTKDEQEELQNFVKTQNKDIAKNKIIEKNTTDFSATENDLNSEISNVSSENIILYSNSASDKKNQEVEELINKVQDTPIVIETKEQNNFNINIDYEVEESNKTIEKNDSVNSLKDFNSYKLKDLQELAEKYNINITKDDKGKTKNKTKKELYTEINNSNN